VSSTGHGSFRAASLPGPTRRGTVPAHLFAYQLSYGVIPRLGWTNTGDAVICHQCDFAGCTNPAHMRLGTNATNRFEYLTRGEGILPTHSQTCEAQPGAHVLSRPRSAPVSQTKKTQQASRYGSDMPKLWACPSPFGDGQRRLCRRDTHPASSLDVISFQALRFGGRGHRLAIQLARPATRLLLDHGTFHAGLPDEVRRVECQNLLRRFLPPDRYARSNNPS
jgi:hypothetical protein